MAGEVTVFRDSVGDSQLSLPHRRRSNPKFEDSFHHISDNYSPGFAFIVVQKRINTRIVFLAGKEFDNTPPTRTWTPSPRAERKCHPMPV